jgi:hypothetical protein
MNPRLVPTHILDEPLGLHPGPGTLSLPTHAELDVVHGDRYQAPLIHRLLDSLEAFNLDRPHPRCRHGVAIMAAGCGPCLHAAGVL